MQYNWCLWLCLDGLAPVSGCRYSGRGRLTVCTLAVSYNPFKQLGIFLTVSDTCALAEQKPNSWTFNFIEVSGHNLESSQTYGFCMDFWNHREGVWISIRFPPFSFTGTVGGLREFEEIEISRQSCRGELWISGKENLRHLSGFRPRIRSQVMALYNSLFFSPLRHRYELLYSVHPGFRLSRTPCLVIKISPWTTVLL